MAKEEKKKRTITPEQQKKMAEARRKKALERKRLKEENADALKELKEQQKLEQKKFLEEQKKRRKEAETMTIDKQKVVRENRQAAAKAKLKAELESLRNSAPVAKEKVDIREEMEDYEEQEQDLEEEEEEELEDPAVKNVVLSEMKDFGEKLEKPKYEEELSDIRKQLAELKRTSVPTPVSSPFEILKGKIHNIAKQLPTEDAKIFRKVAKNYNLDETVEENLKE